MAGNEVRVKASVDDKVSGPLTQMQGKFESFGKKAGAAIGGESQLAKGVGLAAGVVGFGLLTGAAGAAIGAIGDSISAASSLNESLGKSQVVFGDNAKGIEQWADTASSAFGQSKQQALEAAGTYGNLFQAFGVGKEKSADMSKSLVQLAADLASFNNTSVDDALEALRSGLSGEAEPLKRYGVALSDARMRQELMAQGVKDLGATLTPLQKTTASYALIMKDTTLAQGDFARTSDGLANSQRTLDAKMADLSAKMGTALIPIAKAAVGALSGLVDVVTQLGYAFDRTSIPLDKLMAAVANNTPAAVGQFKHLQDAAAEMGMSVEDTYKLMGEAGSQNVDDLRRWQLNVGDVMDRAERSINQVADVTDETADTIDHSAKAMSADFATFAGKAAKSLDKVYLKEKHLTDELGNLANQAISDYFDPIITHDRLMADEAELAAQKKIAASKKSSAAEKHDAISTIHTLEKAVTEERVSLFEAGKLSKKEQGQLLADLKKDWASATGSAKARIGELIAAISRLQNSSGVSITVAPKGNKGYQQRAVGGPVSGGTTYLVGEKGPELFTPGTSGGITPNSALGGGAAMPATIHVHLMLGRRGLREIAETVIDLGSYGRGNPTYNPA